MNLIELRHAMDLETFVFYQPLAGSSFDGCVKEMQSLKEKYGLEVAMVFNGVFVTTMDIEKVGVDKIEDWYREKLKKGNEEESESLDEAVEKRRRQLLIDKFHLFILETIRDDNNFMLCFSGEPGFSGILHFLNVASNIEDKTINKGLFALQVLNDSSGGIPPFSLIEWLKDNGYFDRFINERDYLKIIEYLIDSGYTIK